MIALRDMVGQAHAIESLERVLAAGRVPHAILIHGPEGVGKATAARALAATLLCETAGSQACGRCASCRLIAQGNHPDFLVIQRELKKSARVRADDTGDDDAEDGGASGPEERDLSSQIVVPQIRELSRLAGHAPRLGQRRVFMIDPADRMNAEAQNALLKTLEEPPASTFVILIAARPHVLLPTVRSRCFSLGFAALDTEELSRLLERRGISRSEAELRAALAEGRPGAAIALDLDARRSRRADVLAMLEGLAGRRPAIEDLGRMASALAGEDEATLIGGLELLEGLLRDAARSASGADARALVHRDLAQRLARIGESLGASRAADLIGGVERARSYLRQNANRTLLAETVLASIAGAPLP